MRKLKILVVNGFSSGKMIVGEAKRLGYECYHLSTAMEGVPESYLIHNMAKGYDGILELKDNFEEQVELLRAYDFDIVMPGTESGVILAEKLADALSLPCNDAGLSLARRDKYYMQKRLEETGIPCIKSELVKSAEEAVRWFKSNNLSKVVIKPRMSAGSLGVHICESESEITDAFDELYGQNSCFGETLESPDVLIQEFILGEEIVINHVSHGGVHELTDAWKYGMSGCLPANVELCTELSSEFYEAVKYTEKVLDALGINYGASHTEIMLTDRGPILMETGARLMGQLMPCEYSRKALGYSIVEKCIHSYVYAVDSRDGMCPGVKVAERKYYLVLMKGYRNGKIMGIPGEELLKSCRFVVNIQLEELKESMELCVSTDVVSIVGTFELIGKDEQAIKEWLDLYRMIEEKHDHILYELEDETPLTDEEIQLKQRLISL